MTTYLKFDILVQTYQKDCCNPIVCSYDNQWYTWVSPIFYKKHNSTETALTCIHDDILRAVGEKHCTISPPITGGTARWLQLQPSSSWPRLTVSAFQYFRWCALTKLAVSHFLHQIYSPSKEEALQSLLMSLSTLVFWLFDEENIRRHDGCSKWWRWLQLMFRERWRGLHDSFDELVPLITQEICFKYFWNLAGTFFR